MKIKYTTTSGESEELDSERIEEEISRLSGLYTGQLNERETAILAVAEKLGLACCTYDGMAGVTGLSRVRLYERHRNES